LVVQIGERQFAFNRQIDETTLQLEDVLTGECKTYKVSDFCRAVNNGVYRILHPACDGNKSVAGQVNLEAKQVIAFYKLTEQQAREWERRCAYVRGVRCRGVTRGQRDRLTQLASKIGLARNDGRIPSPSTVWRWLVRYESAGGDFSSLISGNASRKRTRRLDDSIYEYIKSMVKKYFFVRNGESATSVVRRINGAIADDRLPENLVVPSGAISASTVRRVISEVSPFDQDRIRHGPAYASAKWRHAIGGIYVSRPMQRVEMDHTVLDLYVIDEKRGIPLGRPMLTILVDAYSGYILSLYVSFEGPSVARIAQTTKIALSPKDDLTARCNLTQRWLTPGLWETLVLDNGLEFHSRFMRSLSLELCFDIEFCPVRKPWFKAVVERHMLEMARIMPIPGRPEKILGIKNRVDPKVEACVTFSDLCQCLVKWVVDVYPVTINERKLARPLDLLVEGMEKMPPPAYVDNTRSLDVIGGIAKQVRVSHTGIEMLYLTYRSRELADMAKDVAPSFKADIKVNPDDLGAIWVQHPQEKTWIHVPATNQAYAAGLNSFQHKMIRSRAKGKLHADDAYRVLLKSQEELQDMWDKAVRSGRRIKDEAKKLAQLEGVSSSRKLRPDTTSAREIITEDDLRAIPQWRRPPNEIPEFDTFDLTPKLG
jgi:putative transposase